MPSLKDRLKAIAPEWSRRNPPSQDAQTTGSLPAQAIITQIFPNPRSLRQDYLNRLISDYRPVFVTSLDMKGLIPGANLFLLDRLFVTPDTFTSLDTQSPNNETQGSRLLTASEVVAREAGQRLVLLGLPGSGKSTFLCFLALQHARALTSSEMDIDGLLPGWSSSPLLPVLIPLDRLTEKLGYQLPTNARIIEPYLYSNESSRSYATHLLEEADRIGGLFLFDGLDEISDPSKRSQVIQIIQDFAAQHSQHPATRFVVTCRTLSYEDPGWQLPGWSKHELAPFNAAKIHQFIEAWYNELIRLDQAKRADYEAKRTSVLAAFKPGDPYRLLEFASNPLILNTLVIAHTGKGDLPECRASIYQECIDHLLTYWTIDSGQAAGKLNPRRLLDFLHIPRATFEHILEEIAYQAYAHQPELGVTQRSHNSALIPEKLLDTIHQSQIKSDHSATGQHITQALLSYLRQPNGLLTLHCITLPQTTKPGLQPDYTYGFIHPFLSAYLAALYLSHKSDLVYEVRSHLNRGNHWRDVLVLLGEILCFRENDAQRMDSLLKALAPAPLPQEGLSIEAWRAVWMAGDLLKIYQRAFPQRKQEHKHIPRGLVNLLQARGTSLPARERSAAADLLESLGDPRFRQDAWFLPDEALFGFIYIPAGPFCMGSDPLKDPSAKESEQPQHTARLPAYFLSRNLVTVAQFKAFLDESGYQPANTSCLKASLSHPVVYINWQEALLYCQWLTGKLKEMAPRRFKGRIIRENERLFWDGLESGKLVATLPSEAEWEKAARGSNISFLKGDKQKSVDKDRTYDHIYPWGDIFDLNKANTAETGLGTTSPVGCFPMGASSYGILDLAGNVWEWTRTLWGEDFINSSFFFPYVSSDGRENQEASNTILRVIRGGSFLYHCWHTRTSSRGRITPQECDWDIGFRIAVTNLKTTSPRVELNDESVSPL